MGSGPIPIGSGEREKASGGRVEAEGDGGSSGVVAAGVGGGVNGIPIQIGSGGTNLPPDAATRRLHLALVRRHAAPRRLDRPCRSTTTPEPSLATAARLPVARPSPSSSPRVAPEPRRPASLQRW